MINNELQISIFRNQLHNDRYLVYCNGGDVFEVSEINSYIHKIVNKPSNKLDSHNIRFYAKSKGYDKLLDGVYTDDDYRLNISVINDFNHEELKEKIKDMIKYINNSVLGYNDPSVNSLFIRLKLLLTAL